MNTENLYIEAFNNGYILAQHEPGLANTICRNIAPSNFYLQGLFAGKKQFEAEIDRDQLLDFKILRKRSQDKDLGRGSR